MLLETHSSFDDRLLPHFEAVEIAYITANLFEIKK